MRSNKLKFVLVLCFLLSPLLWYLPAWWILRPNPNYSNLSTLNYAPIHNSSVHNYREIFWLDSKSWEFRIAGQPTWQSGVSVPSCWNSISGLEYYEGVAYYRRNFTLTSDWTNKSVFLHFRAVNHYCEATLNDVFLGSHEGGYTPFKFNVTGVINPGQNTVEVKVSNALSSSTVPGSLIGWKNYGGIYREVYLEATNLTYIDSNFISYEIQHGTIVNTTIFHNLTLQNSQINSMNLNCSIQVFNETLNQVASTYKTFNIAPSAAKNVLVVQNCSEIRLWAPASPTLYYVNVSLYENETAKLLDKMVYRIGFKDIELVNSTLYLNQEEFIIKGINRHEDFPGWGKTQPYHLIEHDLALLQELNVNSIRTFHYPNHPTFLERCDELGFFIIEEIPAWNIPASDLARADVIQTGKAQIREMVIRDYNHPCILFWGVGNEIASDTQAGRNFIEEMVQTVQAFDNKTPTYYASNQLEDDISFDLVDVIASNPKYGWYYGDIADLDDYLEFWHQNYPNKPILITEFSAGSEIGDFSGQKFSENYQAYLLQESWEIIRSKNYTIGAYVSCFMDYPQLDRAFNPTAFYNQKGVLSYDRTYSKLAFNATQAMFNETPYLFPIALDPDLLYPYPDPFYHSLFVLLICAPMLVLVVYIFSRARKSNIQDKNDRKYLNRDRTFDEFDLFISIGAFFALITLLYSAVYTFFSTTLISLPIFEIEEQIIFRYLLTDGSFYFLIYFCLYYFMLTTVMVFVMARSLRVKANLSTIFLTHLKTSWIFLICVPLYFLTFLGIGFFIILITILFLIKITLDVIYLRKTLKISRKKMIFLKLWPFFVYIVILLLYLQIRFDVFNLLGLVV